MRRTSPRSLAALLVPLPTILFAVVLYEISGCGLSTQSQVVTETGGELWVIQDEELPPGASLAFYIMLDVPMNRLRRLDTGAKVQVIGMKQEFAKVEVLSGEHKGEIGFIDRDELTQRWQRIAARAAVLLLVEAIAGLLLLASVQFIAWLIEDLWPVRTSSSNDDPSVATVAGGGDVQKG